MNVAISLDPVLPDYNGGWVGAVVPALLGGADSSVLPEVVRTASAVVLLVVDGLGWSMCQQFPQLMPNIASMQGGPITTVAPSTTSAALTSIATGQPPDCHGILGYRMRVGGEVLNVLRWQAGGHAPDPERVQPHQPFGGVPVPVITKSEFRASAFTKAHLRGARFYGYRTVSSLVERARELIVGGERLVYAYSDGVDKVAHEYGLHDGYLQTELRMTDQLVGTLLDVLPVSAALLVVADHGQVHIEDSGLRPLDAFSGMIAAAAGEGRFRTLFGRPGATKELLEATREQFGHEAWVRSRDEAFAAGWFGPDASASASHELRGRIGDVVLAAREPVIFVDKAMPKEVEMRSHHGSLTADEMLVPLLAARGRA